MFTDEIAALPVATAAGTAADRLPPPPPPQAHTSMMTPTAANVRRENMPRLGIIARAHSGGQKKTPSFAEEHASSASGIVKYTVVGGRSRMLDSR